MARERHGRGEKLVEQSAAELHQSRREAPVRFNWRHQYDPVRDEAEGAASGIRCEDPSKTQQSFTEDCDINVLARRFGLDKAPVLPVAMDPSYFGDLSNVPDLRTVLDLGIAAKAKFMELPAKLRARFRNNPAELWEFVQDPENGPEAVRLGLLREATPPAAPAGERSKEEQKAADNGGKA